MSNAAPANPFTSLRARFIIKRIVQYSVAALAIFYAVFPVLFVISASLDPRNSLANQTIIPPAATLDNYHLLLTNPQVSFWNWIGNSLLVSSTASILSVLITALSAYAFSRFRFYGRRTLLLTIFLIQVFPASLTFVAVFLLFQSLGRVIPVLGLGSLWALIFFYLGGVMGINVWLMKGYFDTVPRDLDESAMIDGASHWEIFWNIMLPLVRPIMAIIGILTFIGTYGDYLIPRILLTQTDSYTLAVGLITFARQQFSQNWGTFSAGALLGAIPIVVIYLFVQDFIVSGLTAGSVKG